MRASCRNRLVIAALVAILAVPVFAGPSGDARGRASAEQRGTAADREKPSKLWNRIGQFVLRILSSDLIGPKP